MEMQPAVFLISTELQTKNNIFTNWLCPLLVGKIDGYHIVSMLWLAQFGKPGSLPPAILPNRPQTTRVCKKKSKIET